MKTVNVKNRIKKAKYEIENQTYGSDGIFFSGNRDDFALCWDAIYASRLLVHTNFGRDYFKNNHVAVIEFNGREYALSSVDKRGSGERNEMTIWISAAA